MNVEDTIRKHPHISAEFLDWRQRVGPRWPSEMDPEYIEARKRKEWAPSFTDLGKMRDAALTFALLFNLVFFAVMAYEQIAN